MPSRRYAVYDVDAPKKSANLSLNSSLLETARGMGINISKACERGLLMQISEVEAKRWRKENQEALESSNEFVEKHGVPLGRFRQF